MRIKFQQYEGRPINLRPMPMQEVVKLRENDKVYIWWAKDGNLDDVRVNQVRTVLWIETKDNRVSLSINDGDIDIDLYDVERCPEPNCYDWGGRGLAYFYYPPVKGNA